MDREELEGYLAAGMSLEQIGEVVGRDPSTVGYWVGKHGLRAAHHERHAAKGGLARNDLTRLIDRGASMREIAAELGVSQSTVRHWLGRYGLTTLRGAERLEARNAAGTVDGVLVGGCREHGEVELFVDAQGQVRCPQCRKERVLRRRRKVKQILVEEAGGRCVLCGYDRWPGALHFHHTDPGMKEFGLAAHGNARSLERCRAEARKCVLLCANCHAEVEGKLVSLPTEAAVPR